MRRAISLASYLRGEKVRDFQGPYVIQQLTGGRGEASLQGLGVVPFTDVKNARRSVDEFYAKLNELEGEAASAKKRGRKYEKDGELRLLQAVSQRLAKLRAASAEASDEKKAELRQEMLHLARQALGR